MHIAIVGSRNYSHLNKVTAFVATLPDDTCIVSGGASGVDQTAEQAAKAYHLSTIIYLSDWKSYGKRAGALRNQQIVNKADRLVAFWDGQSKGTKISIDMARARGIPVEIIYDK